MCKMFFLKNINFAVFEKIASALLSSGRENVKREME